MPVNIEDYPMNWSPVPNCHRNGKKKHRTCTKEQNKIVNRYSLTFTEGKLEIG